MDIVLSSSESLYVLCSLVAFVLITIVSLRVKFHMQGKQINKRNENDPENIVSNKYDAVNVFKLRKTLSGISMAVALGFVLTAFSWTTYDQKVYIPDQLNLEDEIEIEIPITDHIKPPPPIPPPPMIEEVIEEIIEEDDQPDFIDQDIDDDTILDNPEPIPQEVELPPSAPIPPPQPVVEVDEVFKVVQQMPRFPGCENITGDQMAKSQCAQGKLLQYIYRHLKYPPIARENGIEGNVVLQFVVGKNGLIDEAKIVRDIGGGCGEAALSVVTKMNAMSEKWTPGKQRGRNVSVLFTLPIRFKLQN